MRRIYVTTRIEINDEADPGEVVQEMDYRFKHPDIVSHEIVDAEELAGNSIRLKKEAK